MAYQAHPIVNAPYTPGPLFYISVFLIIIDSKADNILLHLSVEITTVLNTLYARMSAEGLCVNALMGMKEVEWTAQLYRHVSYSYNYYIKSLIIIMSCMANEKLQFLTALHY